MTTVPTLYFAPQTCARVTLTALEEIGRPFETRLVAFRAGEHRSAEYLSINPSGKVPALDTGNGVITQNGAILPYLARSYPDAGLLPLATDPLGEAASVSALFRLSSDLHPLVTRFVLPGMMLSSGEGALQVREKAEDILLQQLRPIVALLGSRPWCMGNAWSILDAYLAWIWFRITGAGFDGNALPQLADHSARANQRASAQAALAHEKRAELELELRGLAFTPPAIKH